MINEQIAYPKILCREHLNINMLFCHALIRASEGLLIAAGMEEDLDEERGHAEWLAKDLRQMGLDAPVFDPEAAGIAGAQYYNIYHVHPLMLLGYRAALEFKPFLLEDIEHFETLYGVELGCAKHHAVHDIAHGQEIARRIQQIDNMELKQLVLLNMQITQQSIADVLQIRFSIYQGG
jgi:hypothetical protein